MLSFNLLQEPQQCHCAVSREQFLFNDLYDRQTDNCNRDHCVLSALLYALLYYTFSINLEMKGRLEVG